jgi:hypothetical protein
MAALNHMPLNREDITFFFNWNPPLEYRAPTNVLSLSSSFQDVSVDIYMNKDVSAGRITITNHERDHGTTVTTYCNVDTEGKPSRSAITLLSLACDQLMERTVTPGLHIGFKLQAAPMELFLFAVTKKTVQECLLKLGKLRERGAVLSFHRWRPRWTETTGTLVASEVTPQAKGTFAAKANDWSYREWKKRWSNLKECGQTRFWLPECDKVLAKQLLGLGRGMLGVVIQFITGHTWLKRHTDIIEKTDDRACRLCGADGNTYETTETPIHLATTCPELSLVSPFYATHADIAANPAQSQSLSQLLQSQTPSRSQSRELSQSQLHLQPNAVIHPLKFALIVSFVAFLCSGNPEAPPLTISDGFKGIKNFLEHQSTVESDCEEPPLPSSGDDNSSQSPGDSVGIG